jgi:hypothetical protein
MIKDNDRTDRNDRDKSDLFKYSNIDNKTNRSDIRLMPNNDAATAIMKDPEEEKKRKDHNKVVAEEQQKINIDALEFQVPQNINKGKPSYLEIKPYILQNPQMQLYSQINNFAVCPFCKYTGTMQIQYQRSKYQKCICISLMVSIVFIFCCWIPLVIRALSDQVYKCTNCKRVLKTIDHNQV